MASTRVLFLAVGLLLIDGGVIRLPLVNAAEPIASMTDKVHEKALKLWAEPEAEPRRRAVFQISWSNAFGNTVGQGIGTGFMVSDDIALTAGHVVCDLKDPNHPHFSDVRLAIDGPGSSIVPAGFDCFIKDHINGKDWDIAIIRVPPAPSGHRPHLELGAYEDLKQDPFVTVFGFGVEVLGGRPLEGNVILAPLEEGRVLVPFGSVVGDSGAPVLDSRGRAIGVLIAGIAQVRTGFVPLRLFESKLRENSIFLPNPQTPQVIESQEGADGTDTSPTATAVEVGKIEQKYEGNGGVVTGVNTGTISITPSPDSKQTTPKSNRSK